MRKASALQFCFSPLSSVIVWPYRPAWNAHPLGKAKPWLDVRAGDVLVMRHGYEEREVQCVRICRAIPAGYEGIEILSGRTWERTGLLFYRDGRPLLRCLQQMAMGNSPATIRMRQIFGSYSSWSTGRG